MGYEKDSSSCIFNKCIYKLCARVIIFSKIENSPDQSINTILQDSLGFMWLGTNNGLFRYDGYKFNSLRRSIENKNSLTANAINQIETYSCDEYWIATHGGGLNIFNPKKERLKVYGKTVLKFLL